MVQMDQHFIAAVYRIYTPADSLFTKDGRISARSVDWDAHKLFQDVLFKCLGLDDKLVRDGRVVTPVSDDGKWNYSIGMEIRSIEELKQLETPCNLANTPTWTLNIDESQNLL